MPTSNSQQTTKPTYQQICDLVKQDGMRLRELDTQYKNDLVLVRLAVRQNEEAFQLAGDAVINHRGFIRNVLLNNPTLLRYASQELKNNPDFIESLLIFGPYDNHAHFQVLAFAGEAVCDNEQVIRAAIKLSGLVLDYASDRLKNNPEVVRLAVQQNGQALQFASPELKNNRDIVLRAVRQTGTALWHASENLKDDADIVKAAVQKDGLALRDASERLKNHDDIVKTALRNSPYPFQYASKSLVLRRVSDTGTTLQHASAELKNDREVVMAAVSQNGYALQYASVELKNAKEVVLAAVSRSDRALKYAGDPLKHDSDVRAACGQAHNHRFFGPGQGGGADAAPDARMPAT